MVSLFGFRPTGAARRLHAEMQRVSDELQRRGATSPGSAVEITPSGDGEMSALATLMRLGVVVEVRPGAYYYDGVAGERRKKAQLGCMTFLLLVLGAMLLAFGLMALWIFSRSMIP